MSELTTNLGPGGRIVIPAEWRRRLGLGVGDEVILILDEDGVHLLTRAQAIRQAQAIVGKYVRKGARLSESLLDDRRKEARRG